MHFLGYIWQRLDNMGITFLRKKMSMHSKSLQRAMPSHVLPCHAMTCKVKCIWLLEWQLLSTTRCFLHPWETAKRCWANYPAYPSDNMSNRIQQGFAAFLCLKSSPVGHPGRVSPTDLLINPPGPQPGPRSNSLHLPTADILCPHHIPSQHGIFSRWSCPCYR